MSTRSPDLAEDIAQDAFARVFQRFDSLEKPPAYLRVIIVNLCREAHRRQKREHQRAAKLPPPTAPQILEANELLDVLGRLAYRYRTVIKLRYWADWSETDIAAALACRPGTVKTLASRALTKLAKELHR